MKPVLMAVVVLALACGARASEEDDQAAVAAIVPGHIIKESWGWTISTRRGNTSVMRTTGGYTVTTPRETFYLIRTQNGFILSPGRTGVRVLSPYDAYDVLVKKKRRR